MTVGLTAVKTVNTASATYLATWVLTVERPGCPAPIVQKRESVEAWAAPVDWAATNGWAAAGAATTTSRAAARSSWW